MGQRVVSTAEEERSTRRLDLWRAANRAETAESCGRHWAETVQGALDYVDGRWGLNGTTRRDGQLVGGVFEARVVDETHLPPELLESLKAELDDRGWEPDWAAEHAEAIARAAGHDETNKTALLYETGTDAGETAYVVLAGRPQAFFPFPL